MDNPETLDALEPFEENYVTDGEQNNASVIFNTKYSEQLQPFRKCYEAADLPVILLNDSLIILWENKFFTENIGYNKESLDHNFTNLFSNFREEGAIHDLFEKLRSKRYNFSWKGQLERRDPLHLNITVNCVILPFCNIDDERFYFAVFDDVSRDNKALLRGTYLSLLEASKLKDNDTGKHIQRVGEYSRLIAECLFKKKKFAEIDIEFIDNIGFLAQMHDVGKIGTPDDILNKEGSLESWEWKIMKEHTLNGAYILSTYPNPMAKQIALFHHEKWNGEGYPYEIGGEDIPLAARIVSIADVYDALRMKRSYKRAYAHKETVNQINAAKGLHFDPYLIDIFNELEKNVSDIYKNLNDQTAVSKSHKH